MASIRQQLRDLQQFRDDVIAGVYAQRSPLGPGALSGQLIKGKTITANLVDISELAAVSANTGQLNVTGALVAGSGSNTMGYDPSQGLYLGNAVPASAPFRVTSAGAATMTGATVSGGITATTLSANGSGSIAGWTIDSGKLSRDNTGIGASGSYRIWSGNLGSPSLANFSVDSSGSIKSAGGTIGGMTVSSADMQIGTSGGIGNNSGYRLWAGASTPGASAFRVDSVGSLTSTSGSFSGSLSGATGSFTGSVTTSALDANGGYLGTLTVDGTISLGSGGKIQDADGSYWDQNGIVLKSSGSFGDTIKWQVSGVDKGSVFADGTGLWLTGNSSSGLSLVSGGAILYSAVGSLTLVPYISVTTSDVLLSGGSITGYYFKLDSSGRSIASGNIFPGGQTTRYLSDNGTHMGAGGVSTAGSAGALAGYFYWLVNGTAYKVPFYNT